MNDSEYSGASLKSRHRHAIQVGVKTPGRAELPKSVSTKAADDHHKPGFLDGVRQANKAKKLCGHCNKSIVNRPRGLCWGCYYTPGVRELYPSKSKFARRGVGNFSGPAPLPKLPTRAAPGTKEKIDVMVARAKAQTMLFHPADARYEGDPVPEEWLDKWAKEQLTGLAA